MPRARTTRSQLSARLRREESVVLPRRRARRARLWGATGFLPWESGERTLWSEHENGWLPEDRRREGLIAQALDTDEGREALVQAMVAPIRRSMEYQAIGRRMLMVDELPQGALPRYQRDVAAVAGMGPEPDPEQRSWVPESYAGDGSRWEDI